MTVARDQEGEHSLDNLLGEIQPSLRATLVSFRIPYQDAEDLLQQTVVTFLIKRDTIRKPGPWLVGTLRNRCRAYWRTHRKRLYQSVDTAILESVAELGKLDQDRRDLANDLNGVLGKLTSRCRLALELRYGLGCDPAETAKRLGYRRSGIYKILERCLASLTRKLIAVGLLEGRPGAREKRRARTSSPPRASA